MAGIKGQRVDYGASMPESKDMRKGGGPKAPLPAQPTRAQRPIGKSEDQFTSEKSEAELKPRPTSGSK